MESPDPLHPVYMQNGSVIRSFAGVLALVAGAQASEKRMLIANCWHLTRPGRMDSTAYTNLLKDCMEKGDFSPLDSAYWTFRGREAAEQKAGDPARTEFWEEEEWRAQTALEPTTPGFKRPLAALGCPSYAEVGDWLAIMEQANDDPLEVIRSLSTAVPAPVSETPQLQIAQVHHQVEDRLQPKQEE